MTFQSAGRSSVRTAQASNRGKPRSLRQLEETLMRTEITLAVGGMGCAGCAPRPATVARRLDGVARATAHHATGQVRLLVDPAPVDAAAVAERLAAAGFEPVEAGGVR